MKPKEKLASSPVRSSEDVSQRVYLYEGLLGKKWTGKAPCIRRKLGSAMGEGSAEQLLLGFLLMSILTSDSILNSFLIVIYLMGVACAVHTCGGQRTCGSCSLFLPPMWAPGIEPWSSGLTASTLPTEPSH